MENLKLLSDEELNNLVLGETPNEEKSEDAAAPNSAESSDEKSETASESSQTSADSENAESSSQKKTEFVFDRKKFEDQGVKDEAALSIIEKQQKELWEKERFIGRQSNDVGDLRKKVEDFKSQIQVLEDQKKQFAEKQITKEEYDDMSLTSPFEAAQKLRESEESQQKLNQITQEQLKMAIAIKNYEAVPDLDDKYEGMAEIMKLDGLPESFIGEFKQNYKTFFKPELTHSLAKRAEAMQDRRKLEAQIESFKNQAKQSVDRIKNLHQNNPTAGVPGSSSASKRDLSKLDPKFMTMDELKELVNG